MRTNLEVRGYAASAIVCVFLAALASIGAQAKSAREAVWPQPSASPERWVLLYAGGPAKATTYPRYTVEDDVRYVTEVDSSGRPQRWLTTGAIMLSIYGVDGRSFATWAAGKWPALGSDWETYGDSLLVPGGILDRLDSAVALGSSTLGSRAAKYSVVIMIPYPDSGRGFLTFLGKNYDQSLVADRIALAGAYVSTIEHRFTQRAFPQLSLKGFYWLHEEIGGSDSAVVSATAKQIHSDSLLFYWIPYFKAPGYTLWRTFGFDEAWIQPNYFFHPGVPDRQLRDALAIARANSMGMELEFDLRLFGDSGFANRFDPYLTALEGAPDIHARPIALFEGHGALLRLSASRDSREQGLYRRLARDLQR